MEPRPRSLYWKYGSSSCNFSAWVMFKITPHVCCEVEDAYWCYFSPLLWPDKRYLWVWLQLIGGGRRLYYAQEQPYAFGNCPNNGEKKCEECLRHTSPYRSWVFEGEDAYGCSLYPLLWPYKRDLWVCLCRTGEGILPCYAQEHSYDSGTG